RRREISFAPCPASLCRSNLTERDFGLLQARRRIVAVGGDRVGALAQHDRIGAFRIIGAQVVAAKPSAEVERHPGYALADTLGHQSLYLGLRAVFGARHP